MMTLNKIYKENIDTQIINLENGSVVPEKDYNEKLDPQKFDIKKMADDPQYGKAIPADEDKTGIKRQPKIYGHLQGSERRQGQKNHLARIRQRHLVHHVRFYCPRQRSQNGNRIHFL